MSKKNIQKIEYDKESQVLSLKVSKVKSVDSDIRENIVIDYDKKGKIVRINVYNFSFEDFKNNLKELKNFSNNFNYLFSKDRKLRRGGEIGRRDGLKPR